MPVMDTDLYEMYMLFASVKDTGRHPERIRIISMEEAAEMMRALRPGGILPLSFIGEDGS